MCQGTEVSHICDIHYWIDIFEGLVGELIHLFIEWSFQNVSDWPYFLGSLLTYLFQSDACFQIVSSAFMLSTKG